MSNKDAFEKFDQDNPQVWKLFVQLVIKHINAGHKRGSVEFIFNIMRWEHDMETTDPFYKINNNILYFISYIELQNLKIRRFTTGVFNF